MFSAPTDGAWGARAEANAGFTLDSFDPTLCTDDIDDVHIPQISDDGGSQGEWDPNQATSSPPFLHQQPPHGLFSPIISSLRTALADTQESASEDGNRWCRHPIRVGDKIWRECKCGKRRGNGWCCKNQPWEHAFCALVSRVPSLAHPSISSPAGASAPSGVSGPAGSSAPDGMASPLGRSTRLCGNSAADRSSQQVSQNLPSSQVTSTVALSRSQQPGRG
ncbi:hypothetical protein WJX79_010176 [Trebouxia sp. C0005]